MSDETKPAKPPRDPATLNEHDAAVVRLWNAGGNSAASIGAQLGGYSRNSILSTVHRLKAQGIQLVDRKASGNGRMTATTKAQDAARKARAPRTPPAKPKKAPKPEGLEELMGELEAVPFVDRQAAIRAPGRPLEGVPFGGIDECQWPLWGPEEKIGNVCGGPLELIEVNGVMRARNRYCAFHAAAALGRS